MLPVVLRRPRLCRLLHRGRSGEERFRRWLRLRRKSLRLLEARELRLLLLGLEAEGEGVVRAVARRLGHELLLLLGLELLLLVEVGLLGGSLLTRELLLLCLVLW